MLRCVPRFEVFHRRGRSAEEYTLGERQSIERLLDAVDQTPVMRRARVEAGPSGYPTEDADYMNLAMLCGYVKDLKDFAL